MDIWLEEERARQHGKVYNWETAKSGMIWYNEDLHGLRSIETEFPTIVFNHKLSSKKTLSYEPTVSSLNNNEIDFRISFDEFDDEDYTNSNSTQDLLVKEKMESQLETTQTVSALKLPVLKTEEYDLWSMRMEQYLTFTNHTLWEVIVNGDSVSPVALASTGAEGPIPPKTAEQKLARKNELKAKKHSYSSHS
ncbi:hypothetical protein Tco_0382877 [Tanacetum coccineum]